MLRLMLITSCPTIARHAESCGVDRIFVDMEVLGKASRQGHLDTHKASHTLDDVARVREVLDRAELMVRLNPLHAGTPDEIDGAIRHGAARLMLPMFRSPADVRRFLGAVQKRVPVTLLAETPQAVSRLRAYVAELSDGDEVYFGLNDLSLGLGLGFLFEPLAGGLLDQPAAMLREWRIPFGFGGVARLTQGELPAEWVLGEHVRLGSSWVILSRAFHGGADDVQMAQRIDLAAELARLREKEQEWRTAGAEALESNRSRLVERVFAIAEANEMAESLVPLRRILFLQKPESLAKQRQQVVDRLAAGLPKATVSFATSAEEVPAGASFDAVITPTLSWLPEALARPRNVSWIHFLSAGVDKIWEMDFDKQGLFLTKSSGVHAPAMSEFAIGAILFFAKQFGRFWDQSRGRIWERAWLDELTGRTVAILGLGRVGQAVAARARAFGMRVVGTVRSPRSIDGVEHVFAMSETAQALSEADYVVVCLPLTEATRGTINHEALQHLRAGGVLVDVSRGGVVCEAAVLEALDSGRLAGAALDVFETEPLAATSQLWGRPDVLLTPHISGTTPHYLDRALDLFLANAQRLLRGEPPLTPVDVVAGY